MKGMKEAAEYYVPPPKGKYPATVIAAVEKLSGKGNTMIHVTVQLDGMAETLDEYLLTDGTAKGAGMAKVKLRGLGVDVNSNAEVPDSVICQELLGRKVVVDLDHERASVKDSSGNYVDAIYTDPETGKTIALYRARVGAFIMANVAGFAPPAHQPTQAPATQFAPPVQFAPQQFAPPALAPAQQLYAQAPAQQAQPQYAPAIQQAPVQQPQYAPQVQQAPQYAPQQVQQPVQQVQYAPPQQQAPQYQQLPQAQPQYAPPVQQPMAFAPPQQQAPQQPQYAPAPQQAQAPVQFAPPLPPAPVPWATQPEAPAATEPEEGKRKRKVKDAAQG